MKKRNRRSFSPEFKLEAVRLVVEGGRPLSQVARELQLRPELLRGWKKQLDAGGQIARAQTAQGAEEELRRLRREIEVLRMERDFAKKAAAFFAKDLRCASTPKFPQVMNRQRPAPAGVSWGGRRGREGSPGWG